MATNKILVEKISAKYNINEKLAKDIIKEIFTLFTSELSKHHKIEIRKFGTFEVKKKQNNLNWKNKYSLCKQEFYYVLYFKPLLKL